jgi:hypothetical protein
MVVLIGLVRNIPKTHSSKRHRSCSFCISFDRICGQMFFTSEGQCRDAWSAHVLNKHSSYVTCARCTIFNNRCFVMLNRSPCYVSSCITFDAHLNIAPCNHCLKECSKQIIMCADTVTFVGGFGIIFFVMLVCLIHKFRRQPADSQVVGRIGSHLLLSIPFITAPPARIQSRCTHLQSSE